MNVTYLIVVAVEESIHEWVGENRAHSSRMDGVEDRENHGHISVWVLK